jgi:DNA anti-recombination protein RmuC
MYATLIAWFATNRLKMIEYGAIALLVIAILFSIWLSQHQKNAMAEKIGQQDQTISALNAKVDQMNQVQIRLRQDADQITQNAQTMIDDLGRIRDENSKLQNKIAEHDLKAIGAAKPNLLTPRINKGTDEYFKRIEKETRQ